VCFQSFRSSHSYMHHSCLLVGGSYGDASLLGEDHVPLGVLVASNVFRYASQSYRRSAVDLFVHQTALRLTREGFKKCGSQWIVDDI